MYVGYHAHAHARAPTHAHTFHPYLSYNTYGPPTLHHTLYIRAHPPSSHADIYVPPYPLHTTQTSHPLSIIRYMKAHTFSITRYIRPTHLPQTRNVTDQRPLLTLDTLRSHTFKNSYYLNYINNIKVICILV